MGFKFEPLKIPGLILISSDCYSDDRGFFQESYRRDAFRKVDIPDFVQDNRARSCLNVLRGLHYQLNPSAQGKLVQCVHGCVFDVAVDIRVGSPTYGNWFGVELSAENHQMIYVPEGFAHGYCALTPGAEVMYKTTRYWSPQHERAIRWNDPQIGVQWPVSTPIISEKDLAAPFLASADINFVYPQPT